MASVSGSRCFLGINPHALQLVDGRDRKQLARLCRYILRPPLSQERLSACADGLLELTPKKVWKDGTCALVLRPDDPTRAPGQLALPFKSLTLQE